MENEEKTAILFLFFLQWAYPVSGQKIVQNVTGHVIDATTEKGLPFSTVKLSYDGCVATTDSAGYFLFKNVPTGRYDIEASYVGYARIVIKDVIVTSSKETRIEIPLQELAAEVVVTPKVIKYMPLNNMNLSSGRMLSVEEAGRFAVGLDDPARLAGAFAGVATNIGDNGDESITAQEVIFDERLAYSEQLKPVLWADFSVYYRINRRKVSHEFGLKWLNATFHDEYLGHEYNFKTRRVEEYRDGICMPNLYYKICF